MRHLNELLRNEEGLFNLWNQSIFICYRGSIAYGLYNNNKDFPSDKDIIGCFIPTKEIFFGLTEYEQYEKIDGKWDILIYDIKKYFRLLLKSNPNVLETLFIDDKYFLQKKQQFKLIQENRNLFLSKRVYKSFCGYAKSQLEKIISTNAGIYNGEKRKELIDKFGYDTKNASHLIRLLRQGIEVLETGELQVERKDKSDLIQIKNGQWKIEKIKLETDKLFKKIELAYNNSILPEYPDYKNIDNLLKEILYEFYYQ